MRHIGCFFYLMSFPVISAELFFSLSVDVDRCNFYCNCMVEFCIVYTFSILKLVPTREHYSLKRRRKVLDKSREAGGKHPPLFNDTFH